MNTRDPDGPGGFVHISSVVDRVMAAIDRKRAEHARETRQRVVEEPPEKAAS